MLNPNELLAQRATLLNQGREILDLATAEKRETNAIENEQYDKIWSEACALKDQAEALVRTESRRKALDDALDGLTKSTGRVGTMSLPGSGPAYGTDGANSLKPYTFEINRRGTERLVCSFEHGSAGWARHQPAYKKAVSDYLTSGKVSAALQTDISTAGGYMVLPEEFVKELLMNVDNIMWMRKLCRLFTTGAQTLGVVKRTALMSSFAWGAELSTPTFDTSLTFGKRTLTPHYMTGGIQVSRDLLRSTMLPVEEYVRYEIGRDSGYLEENGFLTGTGAGQPLGIFTATSDGIDTSRDVNTYNTTSAIGADNLRTVKYTLKSQYRSHPSLRWLFHRTTIAMISRLKDGVGRYLWKDGVTVGDPDILLGIPVVESEFAPNTYTTGQYVGILGAFWWYWIADSLEMDIQTLVELYAATNQIGYIARRKTDGMAQLAEAFVRVKLA